MPVRPIKEPSLPTADDTAVMLEKAPASTVSVAWWLEVIALMLPMILGLLESIVSRTPVIIKWEPTACAEAK